MIPLYKRLSPADCSNYRGVHLTTLFSKIAEKIIGGPICDFLEKSGIWGNEQFAYRKNHSSSDLLAFVLCTWLPAFHCKTKIGVFCSDIKGAFDRVKTEVLIQKCWHYGVPARAIAFLEAYLAERSAKVVVGGSFSEAFPLKNQVFKGTVLGPKLRNTFLPTLKTYLPE